MFCNVRFFINQLLICVILMARSCKFFTPMFCSNSFLLLYVLLLTLALWNFSDRCLNIYLVLNEVNKFCKANFGITICVNPPNYGKNFLLWEIVAKLAEEVGKNIFCYFSFFVSVNWSKCCMRWEIRRSFKVSNKCFYSVNQIEFIVYDIWEA